MLCVSSFIIVLATLSVVVNALQKEGFVFYETFDENEDVFSNGWVKSTNERYTDQPVMVKPPTKAIPGFENDRGIQLTQEMKHYGFGAKFDQPLTASGGDIVIQYELKLEEQLACGGAYVKLLRDDKDLDVADLSNESPYVIMFGPDKCGSDSKVHFILKHQNPVSKEWTEHHFSGDLKPKLDRSTHLYTLIIRSNNQFELHIDTKPVASGSLLYNLVPPINPPQMIDDPNDVKPADWVDEKFIPDESAMKPEDWDESQPRKLPAGDQTKPADWDEDLPVMVPDPAVAKPDMWDDEEDGYWEAPQIPNPACEKLSGCGPWTPPYVDNPLYKGRWVPPRINNPAYKGVWAPRKIKNDAYFVDPSPYNSIAPMSAIAVEVWTVSAGILFDNFAVTADSAVALEFARNTTALKARAEREAIKKEEKEAELQELQYAMESGTFAEKVQAYCEMIAMYLREHPMIIVDAGIVVVVVMLYFLLFGWSKEDLKNNRSGSKSVKKKISVAGQDSNKAEESDNGNSGAIESKKDK